MSLIEALNLYEKEFNDSFPRMELRFNEQETIQAIKRCIKEGKPASKIFNIRNDVMY